MDKFNIFIRILFSRLVIILISIIITLPFYYVIILYAFNILNIKSWEFYGISGGFYSITYTSTHKYLVKKYIEYLKNKIRTIENQKYWLNKLLTNLKNLT